MTALRIRRLAAADRDLARHLFAMMAAVFAEKTAGLSDPYLDRLLGGEDFWALAAVADDEVVGGLTAHTLPMTRSESSEVFIYDIAVRQDHQRQGVGRQLIAALRESASAAGIQVIFVPADNDDGHALEFYRALGGQASPVTFFTFAAEDG